MNVIQRAERNKQVLEMVGQGLTQQAIAEQLKLSITTIWRITKNGATSDNTRKSRRPSAND